jgi:hypothetical protein
MRDGDAEDSEFLESLVPDAARIVLGEGQQASVTPRLAVRP